MTALWRKLFIMIACTMLFSCAANIKNDTENTLAAGGVEPVNVEYGVESDFKRAVVLMRSLVPIT